MTVHTTTFHNLISSLTGRVGRCDTRDLDQTSLLDTVKLKAVGAIMEYARKHHEDLPTEYSHPVSKVSWKINARDSRNIVVHTSAGFFVFGTATHDPKALKNQRDNPYYYARY